MEAESLRQLDLKSEGLEFASELLISFAQRGFVIVECPIDYWESSSAGVAGRNIQVGLSG